MKHIVVTDKYSFIFLQDMLLFFLDAFFPVYVLTEWFIAVMIPCWIIVSQDKEKHPK